MSLNLMLQRVDKCLTNTNVLKGNFQLLNQEKLNVEEKVKKAKKWLSRQPDYLKFLQHLQSALHQKNIGAFSELLTYFVKDVLKKEKDILLELYTYHNLPALKIEALNDGCRESIYEGNGGSIANIVSTGLRLIALSRLPNRKFIILDEPDCWLKPEHVPVFAKIIGEISEKLKIQTIIISHHDWKYFKDYGRVIELASDGKNLEPTIVHDTPFNEEDNDYIHSIRLRQFMSHQDTEYKLHPYLTCLIGENDIGKSVLATAVKSVAYSDSSDSYIKHHTDEAQVLFNLNKNRQILWQRFKVTTQENPQKVKYSLFENGNLISSEFNSNDVPIFISKELNIVTNEDIDVHIGNQKQPVFLLSSDVKPQDRAKILSLGKESLIIQKMMENIKIKTRQNKQTVKDGEEYYNILNKQLDILKNIENLVEQAELKKEEYLKLITRVEEIDYLNDLLNKYNAFVEIKNLNKSEYYLETPKFNDCSYLYLLLKDMNLQKNIGQINILNKNIIEFDFKNTLELEKYIKRLFFVKKGSEISNINIDVLNINIKEIKDLKILIKEINYQKKLNNIEKINFNIKEAILKINFKELEKIIKEIDSSKELLFDYKIKEENLLILKNNITQEIEEYIFDNKSICPTCNQKIDKNLFNLTNLIICEH